jgi:EAL domain-containing protein (putative c-di-GMP-specific phosphodiesterase class I)
MPLLCPIVKEIASRTNFMFQVHVRKRIFVQTNISLEWHVPQTWDESDEYIGGNMDRAKHVQDDIFIDEIGLHSGRYGAYVLTSSYQPIYRVENRRLVPFGAEGLIKANFNGSQVPPKTFFSSLPDDDQLFVESMCQALHVHNFSYVDSGGLELFFNMNPMAHENLPIALHEIRQTVKHLDKLGICPRNLVCEIIETPAMSTGTLRGIVKELRRHGIRIAIDDYGSEHSNIDRVETLLPDIVKIDGEWFRQIVSFPASARLVATMVNSFKNKNVEVLIEGVETPGQLKAAIDAGADFIQGYLLAGPHMAGEDFEWDVLEIDELLKRDETVVRLPDRAPLETAAFS